MPPRRPRSRLLRRCRRRRRSTLTPKGVEEKEKRGAKKKKGVCAGTPRPRGRSWRRGEPGHPWSTAKGPAFDASTADGTGDRGAGAEWRASGLTAPLGERV